LKKLDMRASQTLFKPLKQNLELRQKNTNQIELLPILFEPF